MNSAQTANPLHSRLTLRVRTRLCVIAAMCLGFGLLMPACEADSPAPSSPAPAPAPPPPAPPAPEPPGAPTGLQVASTGPGFIEWSWEAVAGAEGYQVQFSRDFLFTADDEVVDRTGEQTSYRRENLPAGVTAYLRVRALSGMGEDQLFSDWSGSVSGQSPIPVPSGLTVSASGGDFIEWSWEAAEGASGYQAQYSVDATFTAEDELIDRTAGQISYRRENLSYRTPGHLRVRTVVQVGFERFVGDWSAQVAGLTDPPDPGIEWQLVQEGGGLLSPGGTSGNGLTGVAWDGEDRFVTVGHQGTIAWSDDGGIHWTEASEATEHSLYGVAWGNGRFVAIAYDMIVHSQDGDRWEVASQVPEGQEMRAVAYGNGRFVAVGWSGKVVYSRDGDRWETADAGTEQSFSAVAWGGGRFVAVGASGTILRSPDGAQWDAASEIPVEDTQYLSGIAWGAGRFIAVGGWDARVLRSHDGDKWELVPETPVRGFVDPSVGWGAGRFVLASGHRLFSSVDGTNWMEEVSSELPRGVLFGAPVSNGDRFVAVGYGAGGGFGSIAYESSGVWRPAEVEPALPTLISVTGDAERLVAVGQTILRSADGITWTTAREFETNGRIWGVAYNGDRFVASGHLRRVMLYSDDGDTWLKADVRIDPPGLFRIAWTETAFTAVGSRTVLQSESGENWMAASVPPSILAFDVSSSGGRLVAVGSGPPFHSEDGDLWVAASQPGFERGTLRAIASGDGRFVAVGTVIVFSDDGDVWRQATDPPPPGGFLRDVASDGHRFVAVGASGTILHSEDGDRWESVAEPVTSNTLVGVHWTGTHFVGVGYNGTIVVSPTSEED